MFFSRLFATQIVSFHFLKHTHTHTHAPKDHQAGKVTYASRFGLDQARELADEAVERAEARLAELPGDTTGLRAVTAYLAGREH
jgi:hypothetical protein